MSVVRDLILQADEDLRYPTSGELRSMVDFLGQGAMRISVVRVLTDNETKIVDEAAKQLFRASLSTWHPAATPTVSVSVHSVCAITAGTCVW